MGVRNWGSLGFGGIVGVVVVGNFKKGGEEINMNKGLHNSTHLLKCTHRIGRNGYEYHMACNILKDMGDGRFKIEVFGDRAWGGDKKRIRYVDKHRLLRR